jgi:hypothetical protein
VNDPRALHDVTVSLGVSGDRVYACDRCGFATYSEDDMQHHTCRPSPRVWKWAKWVGGIFGPPGP